MSRAMLKWIIFVLAVLITATALHYALRYMPLGRFGLTFGSRVVHLNVIAFWLVLAVGGIIILVKLIAAHSHK
jgi:hypothetical protein